MKKQDLTAGADALFKALGLKEKIEGLSRMFAGAYMISGEETNDLKEILHRASDELLDIISESITGSKTEEVMSRQQKEESLYKDIPGFFESRFDLLDMDSLKLLIRIMNNHPIDVMESSTALKKFVPWGWVFYFQDDEGCFPVMSREVADILKTVEDPEVRERIFLFSAIRLVINACLGLYGVCTLEQIWDVFLSESDEEQKEKYEDICQVIRELLPYLEEQGVLWQDDSYIISPFLKTPKEYQTLLRMQNKNYYIPDVNLVKNLGFGKLLIKNKEYEAVFQLLNREIKDQEESEDMLEEISEHVTREDWTVPQIMNCLYTWDVVFRNDRSMSRFLEALCEWTCTIRRWSACGHSRRELGAENEDKKYLIHTDDVKNAKSVKIYPNDPCPCGSGKKYKKCCGRK